MNQNAYSIKDLKSDFRPPFYAVNDAIAVRMVKNSLNNENELSLNPEDFQLFKVGSFNTVTGELKSEVNHLVNIVDLCPKKE